MATIVLKNNSDSGANIALEQRELNSIIRDWSGSRVIVKYHELTDSWIFIAIHDTTLGPAVGGCRIETYTRPVDGLRDAMALAEGMTNKWAILNAGRGGAKAVLAMPEALKRPERGSLLRSFGETVEELNGEFQTAGDLGTTELDLKTLRRFTRYVNCFDRATGCLIDSGIYTALGVAAGILSSLKEVFGDSTLSGRRIVIQGVGNVGGQLARILTRGGATVLVCDTKRESLDRLFDEIGCEVISENTALETPCDVYSPCAIGGTIDEESVSRLNSRIIAGGANNQLRDSQIADQIHERGILYAPDYVINAGAAIALPMLYEGAAEADVRTEVCTIGNTLMKLFEEAASLGESPYHTAGRRADLVLKLARLALAAESDPLVVTRHTSAGSDRDGSSAMDH